MEDIIQQNLELGVLFTPDQLKRIIKSIIKDSDQRLWLSILSTTVRDWVKFKSNPTKRTWNNAKDIPSWADSYTFEVIAGLISTLTGISENEFRDKFISWMGPIEWEGEPPFLLTTLYLCKICSDVLDDKELEEHVAKHEEIYIGNMNEYIEEI